MEETGGSFGGLCVEGEGMRGVLMIGAIGMGFDMSDAGKQDGYS